ncbi:MAG: hypothetical protein V3W34_04530 [Phycisphaerae bacterium]
MARMKKPYSDLGYRSLRAWERQTQQLLGELQASREQLTAEVARIDERVDSIRSALGGHVSQVRAAARTGRAGRGGRIGRAVLDALQKGGSLSVSAIVHATGLKRAQVYPSLMSLKRSRKIKAESRGIYALTSKGSTGRVATAAKSSHRGDASGALVKALKRRGSLTKAELASASGLTGRQVHACLMSMVRANTVKANASGTYRLRKRSS